MPKTIPLTRGKVALVDDEDFEWLSQRKWRYASHGYAARTTYNPEIRASGKGHGVGVLYMHRAIMKRYGHEIEGLDVDHINRNSLDNRKCNLRAVPHWQNTLNRDLQSNNNSGYPGVYQRSSGKWTAQIRRKAILGKHRLTVGTFDTPKEAHEARVLIAERLDNAVMKKEYTCPFCLRKFAKSTDLTSHLIYDNCQKKAGKANGKDKPRKA